MDWIGDVSNFVVGATIHWIATISAKILNHPDMQDALAQSVALGVQKLLIEGPPPPLLEHYQQSTSETSSNNTKSSADQQQQLLRILGKWLLALGGGGGKDGHHRSTPKKHKPHKRNNHNHHNHHDTDSATQCTIPIDEEGGSSNPATPTKVIHVTRSTTTGDATSPFVATTPIRGITVSTKEYESAAGDEYQEYIC